MCTAAAYHTKDHYFGRNLDLEYSYRESVTVTPRNFPLPFRCGKTLETHQAIIGMAFVVGGYPLYYDAANEKGLAMAGLNFPDNCCYNPAQEGKDNIAPFEFIPWILSQCATVKEARPLLERLNLTQERFSDQLPLQPLHWMMADKEECIVIEQLKDGLQVYDNPVQVMTNNPTFDYQLFRLNDYRMLTKEPAENHFADGLDLDPYSRGMGGMGLPGDLSSASRFVKVAFTRMNSVTEDDSEMASVSQFFHILGSVEQQRGLVHLGRDEATGKEKYEITIYSSCINQEKGIYYYRTYDNSQISAVDMHHEDLDGKTCVSYPLITEQQVKWVN